MKAKGREPSGPHRWKNGALYLSVFDWPAGGQLTIPALSNTPTGASLLASPETRLNVDTTGEHWTIELPTNAPDPIATVIKVSVDGMPTLAK